MLWLWLGMGNAIMGTGQASGEERAIKAAEDALKNPLLGEVSIKSAKARPRPPVADCT